MAWTETAIMAAAKATVTGWGSVNQYRKLALQHRCERTEDPDAEFAIRLTR